MLKNNIRILLFLTSYFPLFGIIMILHYQTIEVFYILIPVIIISSIALIKVVLDLNKVVGKPINSKHKIENNGKDVLQYFLTYVIPFLALETLGWQNLAVYGIIFFIIGIIYVKSDLICLNPTLLLLGYNIYKVTTDDQEIVVITRNKKNVINNPLIKIGAEVYFERKQNSNHAQDYSVSG